MFPLSRFAALVCLGAAALAAQAQTEVTAVLAGHALLPHDTTVAAPRDAGAFFATAGKFTAPSRLRTETLGAIPANTFVGDPKHPRASGGALPVRGQSVQGFSAIVSLGGDRFLAMTDNGFGSRINSPDALLMVHRLKVDWATGRVQREHTTFLRDPQRRIPFAIQNEATRERYLTGADLDIESLQQVGDEWWIGDEFGPYVIRFDAQGRALGLIETQVGDRTYRSRTTTCRAACRTTPARPAAGRCAARAASSRWRSRRTAARSTRCSSGRCGTPPRRRRKARMAGPTRASSNSTSPAGATPAGSGNTASRRPATSRPTSSCSTPRPVW